MKAGDKVKVSIKGHYLTFTVFRVVRNEDDLQFPTVFASAPGLGSVRFIWHEDQNSGYDNQLRKYYLV